MHDDDEQAEARANRALVALTHCIEMGLSDDECVTAARMMLKVDA